MIDTHEHIEHIEVRVQSLERQMELWAHTIQANTDAVRANIESSGRLSKVIDRFDERLDTWVKRLVDHEIAEQKANASLVHKTILLWWLIAVSMVSTIGWILTLFSPGIATLIKQVTRIIVEGG